MSIKIGIYGCNNPQRSIFRNIEFPPGSTVYSVKKAKKGVLEKIEIRDVRVVTKYGRMINLYQDSFSYLWNEYDLCSYEDALNFYSLYFNNLREEINSLERC